MLTADQVHADPAVRTAALAAFARLEQCTEVDKVTNEHEKALEMVTLINATDFEPKFGGDADFVKGYLIALASYFTLPLVFDNFHNGNGARKDWLDTLDDTLRQIAIQSRFSRIQTQCVEAAGGFGIVGIQFPPDISGDILALRDMHNPLGIGEIAPYDALKTREEKLFWVKKADDITERMIRYVCGLCSEPLASSS